ncbi:MAG: hypothetical protein ABW178_07750 [Pseudoxanthomonas sp.]
MDALALPVTRSGSTNIASDVGRHVIKRFEVQRTHGAHSEHHARAS